MLNRGGRNRAIKFSKGEYICFVDSDDWVDKQFVEKLYHALTDNKADIATADYYEYNKGELTEISHLGKNLKCNTLELKRKILLNGCRLWTSIFKRNLIFDNNLFFPEGVIYEDNAVGPALFLSAKKIKKFDDNLYFYRKNDASTTNLKNDYRFFDRLHTTVLTIQNIEKLRNYNTELSCLKEEIEWIFIKIYFLGTFWGILNRFNPIPSDRLKSIFCGIDTHLPKWRKNKIYRKNISAIRKLFIELVRLFPNTSCILINKFRNQKRFSS